MGQSGDEECTSNSHEGRGMFGTDVRWSLFIVGRLG